MNPETTGPMIPSGQASPDQRKRAKALEELIAEQGVEATATYERLLGSGADLWTDDNEFETFLEHLQAIRREKD
jgi:hypothetical protein